MAIFETTEKYLISLDVKYLAGTLVEFMARKGTLGVDRSEVYTYINIYIFLQHFKLT